MAKKKIIIIGAKAGDVTPPQSGPRTTSIIRTTSTTLTTKG